MSVTRYAEGHGMRTYLERRLRAGLCCAALVAAISIGPHAFAQAPADMPLPPSKLSWYGDPKAPDLSGVWVRADTQGVASASKEGWMPWPPPLKGMFVQTWRKRVADAAAGKRTDDPVQGCVPPGMPRFVTGINGPMLITQTPGRVVMYRDGSPVRRIWLDGRANPPAKDLESFSNGNAIGRYEANDLVTDIVGIKDQPVDSTGIPHSDDLRIVERYHRIDANTLRVVVTLTDRTAYTKPMTSTVTYTRLDDPLWEPREFLCTPKTGYHPEKYVH